MIWGSPACAPLRDGVGGARSRRLGGAPSAAGTSRPTPCPATRAARSIGPCPRPSAPSWCGCAATPSPTPPSPSSSPSGSCPGCGRWRESLGGRPDDGAVSSDVNQRRRPVIDELRALLRGLGGAGEREGPKAVTPPPEAEAPPAPGPRRRRDDQHGGLVVPVGPPVGRPASKVFDAALAGPRQKRLRLEPARRSRVWPSAGGGPPA
jgi:hypothetical protein